MQPQISVFPGTTGSISIAHHSHYPHHHGHPFQTLAFIQNPSLATGQQSSGDIRSPLGMFFSILKF